MTRFIATMWKLSATAEAVEGDAGITRRVVVGVAQDMEEFKAICTDTFTHHVDDSVWFGPVSLAASQAQQQSDLCSVVDVL